MNGLLSLAVHYKPHIPLKKRHNLFKGFSLLTRGCETKALSNQFGKGEGERMEGREAGKEAGIKREK